MLKHSPTQVPLSLAQIIYMLPDNLHTKDVVLSQARLESGYFEIMSAGSLQCNTLDFAQIPGMPPGAHLDDQLAWMSIFLLACLLANKLIKL